MNSKQKGALIKVLDLTNDIIELYNQLSWTNEDLTHCTMIEGILNLSDSFITDKKAQEVTDLLNEIIESSKRISKIKDENEQVDEFKQTSGELLAQANWLKAQIKSA